MIRMARVPFRGAGPDQGTGKHANMRDEHVTWTKQAARGGPWHPSRRPADGIPIPVYRRAVTRLFERPPPYPACPP